MSQFRAGRVAAAIDSLAEGRLRVVGGGKRELWVRGRGSCYRKLFGESAKPLAGNGEVLEWPNRAAC